MPYVITNQGDFLFIRPHGVVTATDVYRYANELEAVEDALPKPLDRITDLTCVEHFDVGYPSVSTLASRRRIRKFANPIKSAIIAREAIQVGLANMFQSLNDNPQIETRIFATMAEAIEWVGKQPGSKLEQAK